MVSTTSPADAGRGGGFRGGGFHGGGYGVRGFYGGRGYYGGATAWLLQRWLRSRYYGGYGYGYPYYGYGGGCWRLWYGQWVWAC